MKIFTVLTISFNNIFTIPSNINNDKTTTQSLIRNKRQNNESYELKLSSAKITINKYAGVPIENIENLYYLDFSEEDKNELLNAPKWIKNQYGSLNNAYFYKNDNGWKSIQKLGINITDKIKFKGNKINLKLTRWKSIMKLVAIEAKTETKPSTDIDLPETTTKFDGNHNYNDIIDNLDYLNCKYKWDSFLK
ncbi:hypothetical protein [Spiroplasma endosymbiont of Lonchoptera lutea]|uniref:hypothetical protein n=1 Tax=Spiroplasma endosymbiont of Lonchoptera lutea TaxID=3066297 RepID=UPI0030CE49E7